MNRDTANIPLVLKRTKDSYRAWHMLLANFNRIDRSTLGQKTDQLFLETLELIFAACFASDKFEKLAMISRTSTKIDLLGFFLQLAWENKTIGQQQYTDLIIPLEEVGRMLGGWKKSLQNKTLRRRP